MPKYFSPSYTQSFPQLFKTYCMIYWLCRELLIKKNVMNSLIKQFGHEKRWVNWNYKPVNGKQTKIPQGSSNDPSTWSTYEDLPNKKDIGIMFGTDHTFLGIDIDHCIEDGEIVHEERDRILALTDQADTYTELSPSGTGIHLYFSLSEPLPLDAHKKAPYECYSSFRFFTVTGVPFGEDKEVRTIDKTEALTLLSNIGYPWGREKTTKDSSVAPQKQSLTDDELLTKMFASKNGDKIKTLYNANPESESEDISSVDMALCTHLAFWTQKNALQIENIWLRSPLGQREKTQKRQDYRSRTIQNAIQGCKEVYKPAIQTTIKINEDEDEKFDFLYTVTDKKQYITLCVENITEFLRRHPEYRGKFRFDNFRNLIEYKDPEWRQLLDIDAIVIQAQISRLVYDFQKVTKAMVFDAISNVAKENEIDSAKDFITSLVWDKKARLDSWLCETYGVDDTEYNRKAGSNWIKGLIKRIIHPGCKFDHVLVLEGEQGTKKSTSLAVLGGSWHLETSSSVESKDFFLLLRGKAIAEFSEGETLSRTEVKKMKSIITTCIDTYRAPYERTVADHPRRCVFAMTTNEKQYLKDETGNRRWWPIETKLEKANVEWLEKNREQLFAEAYHRAIVLNEPAYEMPEEETKAMQDSRRISDPNTDLVLEWYFDKLTEYDRNNGITVVQAHIGALGNEFNKSMKKFEEMNLANIFKNVLKLSKQLCMRNGVQTIRWFPAGTEESQFMEDVQTMSTDEKFKKFD